MRLLLATRNPHKVRELDELLAPHEVDGLPGGVMLPPEHGETFAENALEKARATAAETGRIAIADDSGIEAASLGGRPGVRSARYAGEHATDQENLDKLFREVAPGDALAYVCVLAYVDPHTPVERLFEGRCTGTMAESPRGTNGFGYDPAFIPDDRDDGLTMAEIAPADKAAISHRGRAARALLTWLEG